MAELAYLHLVPIKFANQVCQSKLRMLVISQNLMDPRMQSSLPPHTGDEINLSELFITLWAYKVFISVACAIGIVFGGYSALTATKVFTSEAIFRLDQIKNGGMSLGGDIGALANLAGFSGVGSGVSLPKDQVGGRIFIEKLDKKLKFQADPFFNTYSPNPVDPIWKALIKRLIGSQKPSGDQQEAIWQGIANVYSKNVDLDETLDGGVIVRVTHVNAVRAAEIANAIMDEIIHSLTDKKNIEQDEQLSYLSSTLAKALSDLEMSQSNLKTFALENSALPLESFALGSLQLDALREQLSRTSELHGAVAALALMLRNNTTDQNDYLSLRQQFPIVDQVEFRRVLGQNEIISSWSWPDISSVSAVFDTLSDRRNRLRSQINSSQIDAERSGRALETYAKLEREAKIAEATYTVLIERVKAQSMVAGYRPDNSEIYEYATPPISPSAPNRRMIVSLWAGLGLLMGGVIAYVLAKRRGVHFSQNSLAAGVQARLKASARSLQLLRRCSLNDVNTILMKKPLSVLRDLAVEIHKSGVTQVVVTSSGAKLLGNEVAQALAIYMQSDTMKAAVINFSEKGQKLETAAETISIGSFAVAESVGQVSVLKPDSDLVAMEFLSQRDFVKNLQSLSSSYGMIFLCADNEDSISLLSALEGQNMFHITLARIKYTKANTLSHMCSLLPIQGLLYD